MEPNVVLVSNRKGVMAYVLAVVTMFKNGASETVLKARGKAIVRAIDTAEVVRRKFLQDVVPTKIEIGTEVYKNKNEKGEEDGTTTALSTIEITLKKN